MRILHFWPLDPFSRQVRLALEEKSLRHELQLEVPWERPDDLVSLNPAGTTPVLVDESGGGRRVIVECRAIQEYLEETTPSPCLLPGGPGSTQRRGPRHGAPCFSFCPIRNLRGS